MTLEVKDVSVSYFGDILVLIGVSVTATKGEITCVIGPNGAGKSTLLKTIYGYLTPRRGRVLLDGNDVTELEAYEKLKIGMTYIPQERSVFPTMTVEENLELGAWTFRSDQERVKESLKEIFGRYPRLHERRNVKAGRMSGGEQRMLEIGRALMTKPSTILFDEPTAGLAPKIGKEIYQEIQKLGSEGKTIVLVDQNIVQGIRISDQVYVLELGKVKFNGPRAVAENKLKEIVTSWVKI